MSLSFNFRMWDKGLERQTPVAGQGAATAPSRAGGPGAGRLHVDFTTDKRLYINLELPLWLGGREVLLT